MPNFISFPCPSCGRALEVAREVSKVTCEACGDEHIIYRSGDQLTLSPGKNRKKNPEAGFDQAASEAAIVRLKKELKKSG